MIAIFSRSTSKFPLAKAITSSGRFYSAGEQTAQQLKNGQETLAKVKNLSQSPFLEISDKFKPWMPLLRVGGTIVGIGTVIYTVTNNINGNIKEFRDELKQDINKYRSELKDEISSLRGELKVEVNNSRSELKDEISTSRSEHKADISQLSNKVDHIHNETKIGIKSIENKIDRFRDEMKTEFKSLANKVDRVYDEIKTENRILAKKFDKQSESLHNFREEMLRFTMAKSPVTKDVTLDVIASNDQVLAEGRDRASSIPIDFSDQDWNVLLKLAKREQNL